MVWSFLQFWHHDKLKISNIKTWKKTLLGHTHTHTHPFNGPLSGTTWVSRYQKGKTNLDFTEAWDREWQWHQLGHMQVCTSLQTDNHASTPPLKIFTGRMPFLPPNQQSQSTKGTFRTMHSPLIACLSMSLLKVKLFLQCWSNFLLLTVT